MSFRRELGDPKVTLKHTCGDVAQDLDDVTGWLFVDVTNPHARKGVIRVEITCEDNPIRYAYGTDPTQAGLGHILYPAGSLVLEGMRKISGIKFINHTNGANAVLQITPFFRLGRT